ncbi:hypothetical protein P691DRAFT_808332 [Macrolepiota fuliginosa MF-IS2]|uniref:Uncharacterized protein n=1 Tax=Macrolepiota fuliginosa MF-IS2 TaxID=1400762 RepID=A0A9P5X5Y3_9AGAR|nr:hypothetical protein P691DRAFT_808332 [Macrolepiota fuliginosa MF-IS2]
MQEVQSIVYSRLDSRGRRWGMEGGEERRWHSHHIAHTSMGTTVTLQATNLIWPRWEVPNSTSTTHSRRPSALSGVSIKDDVSVNRNNVLRSRLVP